jgi:hypothetical protein
MRLSNYLRETAQSLLNKVVRQAKKGFNPLKESYGETVELARKYMPEVVEVMEDYIVRPYKSIGKVEQAGICEEVTVVRSKILRAFKVSTQEQIEAMTRWGTYQHESYLYNLIETTFDMSLLVEQGMASTFQQDYELQKTICRLSTLKPYYLGHYQGKIIWVNVNSGEVFRYSYTFKEKIDLEYSGYGDVTVITESGNRVKIVEDYIQIGIWISMTSDENNEQKGLKHEKGKVYQRVQLSYAKTDPYGKGYYISVHHLVGMCVWGYNIIKHCRGFASLLTVDHIDGDSLNNSIANLRVLTRVDNTSIVNTECKRAFDWVEFFERVEKDREDAKGYGKTHYEMLKGLYEKEAI